MDPFKQEAILHNLLCVSEIWSSLTCLGDLVMGLNQFLEITKLPHKLLLIFKVVNNDRKKVISLATSQGSV